MRQVSKRNGSNTLQTPFAGYHVPTSLGRLAYALVSLSGGRIKEGGLERDNKFTHR